jgi:hypothetical protein
LIDPKFLKLIVKQSLKLASPLLGSFVSDVVPEIAGMVIDSETSKVEKDVVGRISKSIQRDLGDLLAADTESTAAAPILATVEAIITNEAALRMAWQEAGYDAGRAADQVISQSQALLYGLSADEVGLCRRVLNSLFSEAGKERRILDATEAHFRRTVLAKLDALASKPIPSPLKERVFTDAVLRIPARIYMADISPPGALLRADIDRPVPFHGREGEIAELTQWCRSDRGLSIRLVTGAGGMGKTRLMTEMCRLLQSETWTSGFLEKITSSDVRSILRSVVVRSPRTFIVVDYAENRRTQIVELVAAAIEVGRQAKLRIVLLARAADDWWEVLRGEGEGVGDVFSGPACSRMALRPLATTVSERAASFKLAQNHFSAILAKPTVSENFPDFADRTFDRALLLHMAALDLVEGVAVTGDQGILGFALDRERRFWRERGNSLGLESIYDRAILQAVAAVTLMGGAKTRADAIQALSKLPLLRNDRPIVLDTIAQLLHDSYGGEFWVDPILPDLLGEHVAQVALEDDPDALLNLVLGNPQP